MLPAEMELDDENAFPKELFFQGYNSTYLYRHWYLAFCDKKAFDITGVCHIDRKPMTYEEFDEGYLKVGKPCILKDAMDHWSAKQWTPDKMIELYGDREFKTNWTEWHESKGKYKRITMTLKDFYYYGRRQHDRDAGYIFDGEFWHQDRIPGIVLSFCHFVRSHTLF